MSAKALLQQAGQFIIETGTGEIPAINYEPWAGYPNFKRVKNNQQRLKFEFKILYGFNKIRMIFRIRKSVGEGDS